MSIISWASFSTISPGSILFHLLFMLPYPLFEDGIGLLGWIIAQLDQLVVYVSSYVYVSHRDKKKNIYRLLNLQASLVYLFYDLGLCIAYHSFAVFGLLVYLKQLVVAHLL